MIEFLFESMQTASSLDSNDIFVLHVNYEKAITFFLMEKIQTHIFAFSNIIREKTVLRIKPLTY